MKRNRIFDHVNIICITIMTIARGDGFLILRMRLLPTL